MPKTSYLIVALLLTVTSCSEETTGPTGGPDVLDTPTGAISNLAHAWSGLNYSEVARTLDSSFKFTFSLNDVLQGNVGVGAWLRADELATAAAMLGQQTPTADSKIPASRIEDSTWGSVKWLYFVPQLGDGLLPPVSSVDFTITVDPEGWTTVDTPGGQRLRQEVQYMLVVVAGATTFTSSSPIPAFIEVRAVVEDGRSHYKLTQWLDDATAPPPETAGFSTHAE